MTKAIKVFTRDEAGRLISGFACGKAGVVYEEGVRSAAPAWLAEHGYDLFCFIHEDKAKPIMWPKQVVYEVEAEGLRPVGELPWIHLDHLVDGIYAPTNEPGWLPDEHVYLATAITPIRLLWERK